MSSLISHLSHLVSLLSLISSLSSHLFSYLISSPCSLLIILSLLTVLSSLSSPLSHLISSRLSHLVFCHLSHLTFCHLSLISSLSLLNEVSLLLCFWVVSLLILTLRLVNLESFLLQVLAIYWWHKVLLFRQLRHMTSFAGVSFGT
jgi:hypothetical protein